MRETSDLEFKSAISNSFLKTVSAYANYRDGRVVFGVEDAGKIVGLTAMKSRNPASISRRTR